MAYSPEQRQAAIETVLAGLSKGTPLTVLCAADGMPGYTTFWEWQQADDQLSEAIARAREAGFDAIAVEALVIADHTADDTIATEHGEKANAEWISRSKLRVETRLKLLAKWDPKRYGDATTVKHADANGEKLPLDDVSIATRAAALISNALARDNAGTE